MIEPWTGSEIEAALESGSRELAAYFASIPLGVFFSGDDRDWGPAHHLSHVTRAHTLVGRAFRDGSSLPSHPSGHSRSHTELQQAYRTGLVSAAARLAERNPIPPNLEPGATRESITSEYVAQASGLRAAIASWSEPELDARAIRHPIMGPLTAREMLLFIRIHDAHHVETVRRKLDAASRGT